VLTTQALLVSIKIERSRDDLGRMGIGAKQLRVCMARNEGQFANFHIKDGNTQTSQLSYDL